MDSGDPSHRRNLSTPQPIPLQDINRPPDSGDEGGQEGLQHRRTLSDRGRDIVRNSIIASGWGGRYEPIEEDSSPSRTAVAPARPTIDTSHDDTGVVTDGGDYSPLEDRSGFQQAIGFAGLSFQPASTPVPAHQPASSSETSGSPAPLLARVESDPYLAERESEDSKNYFPPYTDTAPLTDTRHLQPISGANPSTPTSQLADRSSFQSVRFLTPEDTTPVSRLGDDLPNVEAGFRASRDSPLRRSGSRKRSLSPAAGSPLQRAGTIVRNMSQRVVNLSNEPEIVERSIRRKSSLKQARLHEPPSFPAMHEFAHDGTTEPLPPEEPRPLSPAERQPSLPWQVNANPLRGKSWGIFPPDSWIRTRLCDVLVHPATEPCLFVLIVIQTILLAVDSSDNVYTDERSNKWGTSWIDYGLLILFCIYTLELISRTVVSGFIINPIEYSTINRQIGFRKAVMSKIRNLFAPPKETVAGRTTSTLGAPQPSILRSFTTSQMDMDQPGHSRHQQRKRLAHRAFLRHSFNRLDFVAVVSFWISFFMAVFSFESTRHQYVFRMLSCLRILRLLGLTSGTTVILRSLKKAAPLLVNVAFLIGFFWLLFGIIGVQSFKSSLRRTCVWVDPDRVQGNYTSNITGNFQFCGGYLDEHGVPQPWLYADGTPGASTHKGYLCPQNSLCVEGENPYNGTVSFDNILQSLELVFVIMSSNTFSDLLYYLTDSDYLVAALFFAAGIVIMSLWLINLLIAVITSSFQVIREESKASAFTAEQTEEPPPEDDQGSPVKPRISSLQRLWDRTFWFWIAVIVYGLVCQCLRSATMSDGRQKFIDISETAVTLTLLLEIVARFSINWRHFFKSRSNNVDLALAVITTIIQIPPIHNSGQAYAWLTIFQILRIYRVVLAVPLTRDLIMIVLGNVSGLLNLILFVFLLTFLAAIFAAQLFRGELPQQDASGQEIRVTFFTIYNSFLGMYQILSSENWTSIMYSVTNYDVHFNTAWIGSAFCIIWFILANFIVLNMFIAVIQENFDVSEDEKRLQQVRAFLQRKEMGGVSHGTLALSSIFKLGQITGRRRDPLDYGSHATEMLLKDAVVQDFLDDHDQAGESPGQETPLETRPTMRPAPTLIIGGSLSSLWGRFMKFIKSSEPNPFYSRLEFSRAYEDLDPRQMAKEVFSAQERRKKAQREYLTKHPSYNVSLFIFKPSNPIRRICQRIVGPGRGTQRIDGLAPYDPVWYAFSAFIYAAIVAMVLLACITTPVYQKEYFEKHQFSVKNWFVFTDMGFALLFTVEAAIKVIADGLFWTPNAYFRSSWGFIDGIVLITLWINVVASFMKEGQVSRAVGAFKALRALRLLNVSDSARNTFHSVIVRGGWKVISAFAVSLSLLIPFAIYGLNLFNGRMESCNDSDSSISNLTDCVDEYLSSPFNWDVLAPRQASNPYFDFDNFGNSAFILFQIVSQEGWIDVMWSAQSITGVFTQPKPFASQGNALFFVVFNLLGSVFVLTLFVSVFMRNYTEQTGVAYLTTDQRSWLELRKLLRQVSPSKRPSTSKKRDTWGEWCYRRAVRKTGRWQRFVTFALIFHLVLLCLEFYPQPRWWDRSRDYIFLLLTVVYIGNVIIRIAGLTWTRFRKSSWDIYSLFAVFGTFITTILFLIDMNNRTFMQLHKLFLVSITLLLIPRNNQLDQLFKTAAASLTSIANLMATWFVLFLVYAIALTQAFGLTRFNTNESGNVNFRSVPKALILLFRTSVGEGWNQIMEDFASVTPPNCVVAQEFFDGDCGSPEWARTLFITWNILSMYIFVNLFVSLIYESFSYVYQRSSGLSVISREEIRRFKQAWAEFDPDGTGFISKDAFPRLLGELSGVFEMRIYDGDFSVSRIIEDCCFARRTSELPVQGHEPPREIDLAKLNARLADLPVKEIRQRRARMNTFYQEVLVSSDPDRGIEFNALLRILAHYKVINDNKSLRLEEYLRRRARLQRVEESVRRNVVIGFFDTLYWSRRFQRIQESKKQGRMTAVPQLMVPEIYVEDEDITDADRDHADAPVSPIISSFDHPAAGHDDMLATGSDARSVSPPPEMTLRSRANSIQATPAQSPTRTVSPQISPHHAPHVDGTSDWQFATALSRPPSPLEPGQPSEPARSRQNSNVSAHEVLDVLDNSAWGESIRRSFTQRRSHHGRH